MKTGIKWVLRILSGILLLLIMVILLLHTDPAKKYILKKLENYLAAHIKTEVHIKAINYRLPKWIELDGLFLRDRAGDTLLSGNKVRVDINMLQLLRGQYQISKVLLDQVTAHVSRNANDSNFNYQFLIDAFAGKSPQSKKSNFTLSLDEIDITRSAITWKDNYGGTLLETRIGKFHAIIDSLDIFSQKYAFRKAGIEDMLFDLQILNIPDKAPLVVVAEKSPQRLMPLITVKELQIARSYIAFDGQNTGFHTINTISDLHLTAFSMAGAQQIRIDKFRLANSSLLLNRTDKVLPAGALKDTTTVRQLYAVQQAQLFNNAIAFNDLSVKRKRKGLDANHIALSALSGGITGFRYADAELKAHVDSLSAKEQTGFILDSLRGDYSIHDTLIVAKNLYMKTPLSRISGNVFVYPKSLEERYRGNLQNHLQFTENIIAAKDLAFLAPDLMEKYKQSFKGISFVYLTTDLKGNAKQLLIKTISLHSNRNDILINAGGSLYNAFSADGIQYDLFISKAVASKSFLEPFVNKNGKQTINLPPSITLTGKLKGDLKQLTSDINIASLYGMASFKGQLRNFTKPDKLGYNMRILAKELETGKWINRDSLLGKLNGTIVLKGSGIDYKTATISSVLDLGSFRLKQHMYTGIHFNVNGTVGEYDFKGNITDSLLRLDMDMRTAVNKPYPSAEGKIHVKNPYLF